MSWCARLLLAAICLQGGLAYAQQPSLSDPAVSAAVPQEQEATLTYANRPIIVFRARILTRKPAERVSSAVQAIDELVSRGITGPVGTRPAAGWMIVTVGNEGVFAVLPADVDVLEGETIEGTAETAAGHLRTALAEASELHTARSLLKAIVSVIGVTVLLWFVVRILRRTGRAAERRLTRVAEHRMFRVWNALGMMQLPRVTAFLVNVLVLAIDASLVYLWLTFVLRQFPYTRPLGESLRSMLFAQVNAGAATVMASLPGVLTVIIILVIARAVTKTLALIFAAVEHGRIAIPGIYPDTAVASRRMATVAVWLLAAAMAYPHIPGSNSDAFKGLSIFVGVIVSIGSSGVMQHLMSGLMLTFSRAIHEGDVARIGDIYGIVVDLGPVATKLRTPYGEEITIPNAVVVSQTTTNYSKVPGANMPFLTTSVTIGYDTPWRQVEGLLLTAAQRTAGIRKEPAPFVRREALEDYYVKYTLLVAPEEPRDRADLLDQLHVQILDTFNEFGVQIMSPHYMTDPPEPKVVPQPRWFQPPADPRPADSRHDASRRT